MLFYWLISPTLHGGPVWYVYQNDVAHCDKRWWRSILLFDNLFSSKQYLLDQFFITQAQFDDPFFEYTSEKDIPNFEIDFSL